MNRKERCWILINSKSGLLRKIGTDIEQYCSIQLIDEPQEAMVMVRMRDTARNTPFYMGEVLVTESRVQVEGFIGIGLIKGHHPEKAYNLALVDGAFNSKTERVPLWESWIKEEKPMVEQEFRNESSRAMKTKVDFSTMEDQGVELKRD